MLRTALCVAVLGTCLMASTSNAAPELLEASIEELQELLASGEVTSVRLVEFYQRRIEAYDQNGPALNAIQHRNSSALTQAAALDEERKKSGPRSPLHGIPVLVKDNFETIDAPTTAGSVILASHWPKQDASQIARLRQAGAIVLAKTTMHEFAYGWTTIGSAFGATRNPYGIDRHPGGSSGGTGAGVAANFAAAGMGSDTCGSIRVPAAHNNLVGMRGTPGLASSAGIVPLSSTRDIGGPLARGTRDLAIMLDATVGYDARDPKTAESFGKIPESYLSDLALVDPSRLRLGVLDDWFGDEPEHEPVNDVIDRVLDVLAEHGATIVRLSSPALRALETEARAPGAYFIDGYDLKRDLTAYLRQFSALPVQSFAEVVADERLEPRVAALWRDMLNPEYDSRATYLETLASGARMRTRLLTLLNDEDLDALVYPTSIGEAAPLSEEQNHFNCMLARAAGLPAISVPAGFGASDMPVAVELLAETWAEQKLLDLAYTLEQLVPVRKLPRHTP